jgi:rare lipoprotein A (peptidoglycan hydrolase)
MHKQEQSIMSLHYSLVLLFVVRPFMRLLIGIVAIATVPAWLAVHVNPAAAQTFIDRWSIIPKAHAEPPPEPPDQTKENPLVQPPTGEPPRQPQGRSASRPSFKRVFSGKASYYSYPTGKTASGSPFNRDSLTAAHRNLPFGTRLRVTSLASSKSVVVRITDRGPWVRGRVLDLSLGAARNLGIAERGVAQVRAEVL